MSKSSMRVAAIVCALGATLAVGGRAGAEPAAQQWSPPVSGVVVDGFRPPGHIGGAGNRGWEYSVAAGTTVRAAGAGTVAFAGRIGANLYVSIDHACGLRTTYSFVATISVRRGDGVALGGALATTGSTFHFGLRQGATYLDPGLLFTGAGSATVRLVSVTIGGDTRIR